MRRRRRVRRVAKWVGLVVCVLVAVCWVVNFWWNFALMPGDTLVVGAVGGGFVVNWISGWNEQPIEVIIYKNEFGFGWLPEMIISRSGGDTGVPFWLVLSVFVPVTGVLWWRDRRRIPPGHCRCGYDLTGNVSGRCPECGQEV
jgi:hypothetical protein